MRARVVPTLACLVTLVAGLAVHAGPSNAFSDKAGDVLYAALATLGVWWLAPPAPRRLLGAVAFAWCLCVELLQLTGIPRAAADVLPASRLVLGTGFDALDLPAYAVGVVLALAVVTAVRTRRA